MMSGGFQFLDLILFALIAAFLVLRLRGVLGRRGGHEGGYHDPFSGRRKKTKSGEETKSGDDDKVVQLSDRQDAPALAEAEAGVELEAEPEPEPASPLDAGLAQIQNADPDFDGADFLSGARIAFDLVLSAYVSGDTGALGSLLGPETYGNFAQAIDDREREGHVMADTLVGIKSAEILEAYMEGTVANVTVKFISEQVHAIEDEDGNVVEGDPDTITEVTDFWTFAHDTKTRDPNWSLVATRSLD